MSMTSTTPKPGIRLAVWMTFVALIAQCLVGVGLEILGLIVAHLMGVPSAPLTQHPLVLAVVNTIVLGEVIAWGVSINGGCWREVLPFRPVPMRLAATACLTMLGGIILLSEVNNVMHWLLPPPEFLRKMFAEMAGETHGLWAGVLLLVVVAPVTEELFFRGILLRGLASRHRWRTALLVSATLFALMHANPWQFCSALAAGLVFGWWYLRTQSLVLCLFGHAMMNGLSLVLPMLGAAGLEISGFIGNAQAAEAQFQPAWLNVTGLVLTGVGLALFDRLAPPRPEPPIASTANGTGPGRADESVPPPLPLG
jgi:membrane protease YdiL (CAAX protease family)